MTTMAGAEVVLNKKAISALVPHAFGMCLLDGVLHWDERTLECISDSHRDIANPLRDADGLRALHAFEYAAQAAALHGALASGVGPPPRPAWLASVRSARLYVSRIDGLDATLHIAVERLLTAVAGTIYACRVDAGVAAPVACGRLTVMPRRLP